MANNLTGDFDAIFQVSVKQINGILATMHQSRIDPSASPTFPHSIIIPVGELPEILQPWNKYFVQWVGGVAQQVRETGGIAEEVIPTFYTKSLPEVSALYKKAFASVEDARFIVPSSGRVRGTAYVQVSTPTITLRGGATSAITVHVDVRALFIPDSGAGTLPGPIHGEVQANYVATTKMVGTRRVVHVLVPSQDDQIQFYPAAGTNLSAPEVAEVAAEIRKALRKHFVPTDVDIPGDFPVSEFIALGSGPGQALALPLQLSNAAPAGDISSVTNHLLGTSEFAIAVSKQYVETQFAPVVQAMKDYASAFTINVSTPIASTVYHASISNVAITWKPGTIDFSATIDLTTRSVLPNQWITFTQTVTLELDVPSQTVNLKAVGDPSVNESSLVPHDVAVNGVKAARDQAIAKSSLTAIFGDVRNKLIAGLQKFDKYAIVKYLTVEVTPDGIILRGKIDSSDRLDPVVHFEETPDRTALTAFLSWIPGGTIDLYEWTWPEGAAWYSLVGHSDEPHRFVLPKSPAIVAASRICLRIQGTRITADGNVENVMAGHICKPSWSEPVLVQPPWWMKVMVPVWLPDWPDQVSLEDAIAGYINVAGQSRDPGRLTTNTLVHFTGARLERPLEALGEVMSQSRRQDGSLLMILVLPAGTFRATRREVEDRLGSLDERFAGHLLITEDYLGAWTKMFSARETPSTFFLNALREFVWKHEGAINAETFAAALDQHMVPAPAPPTALMQLNVRPGEFAPNTLLEDERGEAIALNRLRGQKVVINFWQSWAKPCLRELRALQGLLDQGGENAPLIFAVNGGEDRAVFEEVRRDYDLKFPLIQDPDERIAAIFGVQHWPTTIFINREGMIDRVQFGISQEQREEIAGARS